MTTREELVLRPYQEMMRGFALKRPSCALWADMGLGKTPTALAVMSDALFDRVDVERWLVVGPKLVVEDAWPRQLNRWRQFADLDYRVLGAADFGMRAARDVETGRRAGLTFGDRSDKRATKQRLLAGRQLVTLVSWDWLPWLVKACGVNWPWDGLVLDEAIFVQDWQSGRNRAVRAVQSLGRVNRLIELTGAPVPNGYDQLQGQIMLLDGGKRLGHTMTEFRQWWMAPDQWDKNAGRVWSWRLAPGARAQIDAELTDLCVSLRSEDYLDLPELVMNPIRIELPPAARRAYNDMERHLVATVGGVDVLSASQGVLVGKLLQIASGAMYDNAGTWHNLHEVKLDRLAELLEAEPGPVLLMYPFKPDWERIKKRFKFARHMKEAGVLDAFRAGRVKLLCMHPGSGAHGNDGLQEVSSCAVWFGATYNADHWLQANKRLHRDGQRAGRVVVHQLLAADTIEEYVSGQALSEKLSTQEHLLKALVARVH